MKTLTVCRDCHHAIHRIVPDHKQLARYYNTRDRLLAHDDIHAFVAWVRKRK